MSQETDLEPKWYVIHTYSGYENKVKADLEKKVKNQEIIYYERNITIKNDIYKNGVFKFIIILTDYETRENNAYIQFLNDDYTYQFDTNKDYQIVVTKNKIITTYRGSR